MIKFSVAFISCLIIVSAYSAGKLEQEIPRFKESLEELGEDLNEIEHLAAWEIFKEQYSKQYGDAENERRKKIFLENKNKIAQHNQRYHRGEVSFKLGLNKYADLLHHEFVAHMNGFNRSTELKKYKGVSKPVEQPIFFVEPANVEIPTSVDWREKGAVTKVKNQFFCGSCWAFSATGALEGQHFRKSGVLVSLSEQNLVDCSTSHGNNGCNGGWMDQAFEYIKDNGGIDTEKSYPYEGIDGTCRYNAENSGATVRGFVDIPKGNETKLAAAIATVGPVSVAIDASHFSFAFYLSGVYEEPDCDSKRLNHGVLAVGYGTDKSGKDYYLVKNSWGTLWGDNGYIKMIRNKHNNCGIATKASYPLV